MENRSAPSDEDPAHGEPAADQAPPGQRRLLPRDVPDFVGRGAELDRLLTSVAATGGDGESVVLIDGMAGVGKTTLALHAAHLLADRYPDGALYVDLHGHSPEHRAVDSTAALGMLLRAWGTPGDRIPEDAKDRADVWRGELADRRALVLLDNVLDSRQIRPLLPGGTSCLVLATSRRRLAGLDAASTLSLEVMSDTDAQALLATSVGNGTLAAEPTAAADVVELCGRLPVAIRIAGSRLRRHPGWTVGTLANRLRAVHRRLPELGVEDSRVSAAFTLSYQQLRPREQRMFRLLGLIPGRDIDAYAAAELADLPLRVAEEILEDLLDAHLLMQRDADRYTFHDLLRDHAYQTAMADELEQSREAALQRLLDYQLVAAATAAHRLSPDMRRVGELPVSHPPADLPPLPDRGAALAWFVSERPNLVAAIEFATWHGRPAHAWQLAQAMWRFLFSGGYTDDWIGTHELAADAARAAGDGLGEATTLTNLGPAYLHIGRGDRALELLGQAVEVCRRISNRWGEARALGNMAPVHLRRGQYAEALALGQQAAELFREVGDRRTEAIMLTNVGYALRELGRLDQAFGTFTQALALSRTVGDRTNEGRLLDNIGYTKARIGRYAEAIDYHLGALAIYRDTGDRWGEGGALGNLGMAHRRLGRSEEAFECLERALVLMREASYAGGQADMLNGLGETHRDTGRGELAMAHHRQALEIAQPIGERYQQARALDGIAHAHALAGQLDEAREHWRRSLELYEDLGLPEAADVRTQLELHG